MSRRAISRASLVGLMLFVTASCSKPSSPGETQAGAASDANRAPYAGGERATCRDLPSADDLKKWLREAPGVEGEAGGLFSGKMEWGTIVNRQGEICATAVATDDPASAWPGSQAISKAKAYTANAYSTDDSPLSTARLYTLTQPGHSLWGVAEPNPFRADCLVGPKDMNATNGKICGGSIAFGGGVPLYRERPASAASASAVIRRAPITRSPSACVISHSWIRIKANSPTTLFSPRPTARRHSRTHSAPTPGGTDKSSATKRRRPGTDWP